MFPFYNKKKKSPSAPKKRKKSKPDLVKRLDKVFALYIRLRDCMPIWRPDSMKITAMQNVSGVTE